MLSATNQNWPSGRWVLECVDIEAVTHDVKSFHFKVLPQNEGSAPLCLHRPGQFVTLRLQFGDKLVPRSYTISSSPSRPLLMSLTIKRDPNGLVSRYMHDCVNVGDRLPVSGPGGTFDLISVTPRNKIVMLTGGSGITPAMSMLRHIHDTRATHHHVMFMHSARTPDDIIFRDELTMMAKRDNITVQYVCERDAEPGMEQGFLTQDILERNIADIHDCTVLTCGPAAYMDAVKSMLGESGFDMSQYHEESFGDPSERQNPDEAVPEALIPESNEVAGQEEDTDTDVASAQPENAGTNNIVFVLSGKTVNYQPGETILQVATREGIAIATNCQMGLCGTCKAICKSGTVKMDDTEGLEPEEADVGYVLTCCGRPSGPIEIEI